MLAGWLDERTALRLLRARGATQGEGELLELLERARATVASRTPHVTRPSTVGPPVALDDDHAARVAAAGEDPSSVRSVRLGALVAIQPYVFSDHVVAGAGAPSVADVTDVAIPEPGTSPIAFGYDEGDDAFVVHSADQSLRVLGRFEGPVPGAPPWALGVGFLVAAPHEPLRVAVVDGRAVLLDGHHRAVALLASGVAEAPAVVVDAGALPEAETDGMLGAAVALGDRPALVADYLDDKVSAATTLRYVGREVRVKVFERDLVAEDG